MSSKTKFTGYRQHMVAGVCLPIDHLGFADHDELLREAIRIALRMDTDPKGADLDDRYDRIRGLMDAYLRTAGGAGEDAATLLSRLAAAIADVIPQAVRKTLIDQP